MKILQVMAGAEHGGAETAFADTCIALHEAGHTVEVATRAHPARRKRLEGAGLRVHSLPFGGRIDLYTRWKLAGIISAFRPAIVQTWMSRAAMHIPAHDVRDYVAVSRLGGYYGLKYFRNTDYFTTITPDIRRYLIEGGIHPDRVRHINNFAETEAAGAPLPRASLDTPESAPLLLALGRLHTAKAFDTLLRALAQCPGIYLWIAGEGPERENLERLKDELNLADRVRLLGWRDDRAALLQACDICVFPSRYEPFGTVFVQAWAQRRPLICTAAQGPVQYVRDGRDALMTPVDDVPALATAIRRLAADRALGGALAEAGFARYQAEFTKEKTLSAYISFYEWTLEQAVQKN